MLAPRPSPTDRRLSVATIPVASNNAVPVHRVRAVTSQQRMGAYIWTETSMPEAASNGVSDAGHRDVAPREAQSHVSAMGIKAPSQRPCTPSVNWASKNAFRSEVGPLLFEGSWVTTWTVQAPKQQPMRSTQRLERHLYSTWRTPAVQVTLAFLIFPSFLASRAFWTSA